MSSQPARPQNGRRDSRSSGGGARPVRSRASRSRSRSVGGLRGAVSGRESDLAGLGLFALALLFALGTYGDVAGFVGHGLDWLSGVLVGVGRFLVPIMLAAVALAVIVKRKAAQPGRLVLGWVLASVAGLGLLHVARGPSVGVPVKSLRRGGGLIGLAVGRPLRAALQGAGSVLILVVLLVAALLIITRASLRSVASGTARRVSAGVRPGIRAARRAMGEMTTLASERLGAGDDPNNDLIDVRELPRPPLYDLAAEEGAAGTGGGPAGRARGGRKKALAPPDPSTRAPTGPAEQLSIDLGPGVERGTWKLPSMDLLVRTQEQTVDMRAIHERGQALVAALASHGVGTKLLGQTVGPTVTRYELELEEGVKVARLTALNKDIAYAMAAADVRILAPIPGRKAIGVEVPNVNRHLVALGDLLTSPEAVRAVHPLEVGIGKDIAGRAVMLNLATTPHLLIAGATGAGKSSGINCLVTSILMRTTPEQVRLILIDPKRVEMGQYNQLPHLLTQVVTNPKKAANALQWAVKEMERRYDLLHEVGTRDITGYNAAFDRGELTNGGRVGDASPLDPLDPQAPHDRVYERLPFIVIVVDELNDLMMVAARDVEDCITRIAQMARAVGIHLVIATQRPSVNVLTGVIKANVPARIAFAVSSLTDSRVILDQPGAEKLVGKGDMLLLGPASSVAQRIQGAFVTEEEVRKVTAHWKRQAPQVTYVQGVEGAEDTSGASSLFGSSGGDDEDDETLMRQAMDLVVRSQLGSTSMLQRKLKVGFARAGRLMDLLEQRGVVGPSEGSKARSVLMSVEELDLLQRAERDD